MLCSPPTPPSPDSSLTPSWTQISEQNLWAWSAPAWSMAPRRPPGPGCCCWHCPLYRWGDTAAPCGSYEVCWLLAGLQRQPLCSVPSPQLQARWSSPSGLGGLQLRGGWSVRAPSTAGKPEPQPTAPFPPRDPVSYFFRLRFSERNQHINDFFPSEATE